MKKVLSKLNVTKKIKHYSFLPAMALTLNFGGFADAVPSDYKEIKMMDAETVGKLLDKNTDGYKFSQAEKKEAFKAFKEQAAKVKFPKHITKLVTMDTILDYSFPGDTCVDCVVYAGNNFYIAISKTDRGYISFPDITLYDVQPKDIAEPLPPVSNGINKKTKKPYFSMPENLMNTLSDEDKAYIKTVHKVMNTNFGTMAIIPSLDEAKIKKNAYAAKLIDKPVVLFGDKFPMLEKDMDETEIAIRQKLGFLLNGAAEMKKAGARLRFSTAACTGWRDHRLMLNKQELQSPVFTVPNGILNIKGLIPYSRTDIIRGQIDYLGIVQRKFQNLLRENSVEPGTDVQQTGLTPKQQILTGWYNALNHYINNLYKAKYIPEYSSFLKDQKLKTLDTFIGPENTTSPQEIRLIDTWTAKKIGNAGLSNFNKINLALREREN